MTRFGRFLALTCLSLLTAASIGVPAALAAPVASWESISVNLGSSSDSSVLLVAGVLPDSTKLPATVELAAPKGSTLQWAGEILGGDASADIEVATTKSERDGQDIYKLTLTKARVAQIEVTTEPPATFDGTVYTVNYSLPAWADVPSAGVAIQIPASARLSQPASGTASLAPGPTGYQYYQQEFTKVKKGDPLAVSFSYTLSAAAPTAGATSGTGGALVPIILIAIAVALGVGLVIGVRRKLAGGADSGETVRDSGDRAIKAAATKQSAASSSKSVAADEVVDDEEVAETAPKKGMSVAMIGTLVIVALAVGAGVIAASQGGKAKSVGTTISKTFAGGEACTSATIPLAIPDSVDPAVAAEQVFTALASVPSITEATVDLAASSIKVGYCDSQATEDMVRQAIAPTGFMAAGSASTPAEAGGATEASGTTP